ncbi:hypothetical protein NE237_011448 [Protea cynaroides]|uniref:Uncharacterized protein n=1 Tax=Protea cynaroides TaxID=273540 RepID=A0A9Q0JXY3_9MAGN|nr:hypothetical protein NE237_011448 [Protea cynaroides]
MGGWKSECMTVCISIYLVNKRKEKKKRFIYVRFDDNLGFCGSLPPSLYTVDSALCHVMCFCSLGGSVSHEQCEQENLETLIRHWNLSAYCVIISSLHQSKHLSTRHYPWEALDDLHKFL